MSLCGRCGRRGAGEICWYCDAPLCSKCWGNVGHCGHAEAEAMNKQSTLGIFSPIRLSEAKAHHERERQ